MSLGVGLEQELGYEFRGDFSEFDEVGGHFLVWLQEKGVSLMSLGVRLVSLAAGLEQELFDEFGGDFDEFDEFGGHFLVFLRGTGSLMISGLF